MTSNTSSITNSIQNGPSCPISGIQVDSNTTRIIAGLVVLTLAIHLAFSFSLLLPILLMVDFLLRISGKTKYSPFATLARLISKKLRLNIKLQDAAPKKFAATLGFIFSTTLLILQVAFFTAESQTLSESLYFAQLVLSILFGFFALLESAFGFCVGCVIYQFVVRVNHKISNAQVLQNGI